MAEQEFERTEPATQRRREEARQEGNVARSHDLTAAAMLLAGIVLLNWFGMKLLGGLRLTMAHMLASDFSANPTRPGDLTELAAYAARIIVEAITPLIFCMVAVGVAVTAGQVGIRLSPQAIRPDFKRLSPMRGLTNLVNARGRIRLLMSVGKVAVVFGIAMWFVWADLPRIAVLSELEPMLIFGSVCEMVYILALKIAVLLLVLAVLDYGYQFWQRERDLRMTKQEVKEEFKRMEGDPLIKQRRGRVARQLAMQRVNAAVPHADVVVTNPTHFAVALKYEPGTMKAPKVVAKGADYLAMRIRQLAALNEVPIVERRELARALYAGVEVGQEVPPQFYNAVAEVLAYVYRLSGRKIA